MTLHFGGGSTSVNFYVEWHAPFVADTTKASQCKGGWRCGGQRHFCHGRGGCAMHSHLPITVACWVGAAKVGGTGKVCVAPAVSDALIKHGGTVVQCVPLHSSLLPQHPSNSLSVRSPSGT